MWCCARRRPASTGKVYNLGLPVQRAGVPVFDYRGAPQRLTLTSQTDEGAYADFGAPDGLGANEDVLVIAAHNGTHMDALCHVYSDGQMYNGFSKDTFSSQNGAGRCGIEKTGGFAARAVLADLAGHMGVECLEPGYKISGDEIENCLAAQGVSVRPGDALLVRTGWLDLFDRVHRRGHPVRRSPSPGSRCPASTSSATTSWRPSAPTTPPSNASRSTTTASWRCTSNCW